MAQYLKLELRLETKKQKYLCKSEDVVNEEKHILTLSITEIFCYCQTYITKSSMILSSLKKDWRKRPLKHVPGQSSCLWLTTFGRCCSSTKQDCPSPIIKKNISRPWLYLDWRVLSGQFTLQIPLTKCPHRIKWSLAQKIPTRKPLGRLPRIWGKVSLQIHHKELWISALMVRVVFQSPFSGFEFGNTCESHSSTGTWRLIHLSIYKSTLWISNLISYLVHTLKIHPHQWKLIKMCSLAPSKLHFTLIQAKFNELQKLVL